MKQGIVGGLLVIGGVILSPFGQQTLEWANALALTILSAMFSAWNYAWTAWTHGGSEGVLLSFLVTLWALLLVDAGVAMIAAFFFVVRAVTILTLDQTRNTRVGFGEIVSDLRYSCVTFFICILFLYFASWVDVGIGAWTTQSSVFAEGTYNSLFFWGTRGYLYVYPLSMFVAGLFILKESCRKLRQSMLRE